MPIDYDRLTAALGSTDNVTFRIFQDTGLLDEDLKPRSAFNGWQTRDSFAARRDMSGLWYNPDQSDHGFELTFIDWNRLVAFCYTFDPEGNPLWLLADGAVDRDTVTLTALDACGMLFGGFDLATLLSNTWGEIRIQVSNCNRIEVTPSALRQWFKSARFRRGFWMDVLVLLVLLVLAFSNKAAQQGDRLVLRRVTGNMRLGWLYEVRDESSGQRHEPPTTRGIPFTNHRFSMMLFPGRPVELDLDLLHEPILGVYSLTGTVVGDGNSSVVLTVGNGEIEGKIDAFGSSYVIQTLDPAIGNSGRARVEILELDPAVLNSYEGRDLNLPGPKRSKRSSSVEKAGSGGKATVLILYTSAVSQERNMDSFASSIIASLNSALSTAAIDNTTIRVRACNAGGCGGYANGDNAATYTSGCF